MVSFWTELRPGLPDCTEIFCACYSLCYERFCGVCGWGCTKKLHPLPHFSFHSVRWTPYSLGDRRRLLRACQIKCSPRGNWSDQPSAPNPSIAPPGPLLLLSTRDRVFSIFGVHSQYSFNKSVLMCLVSTHSTHHLPYSRS